MKKLLIGMLFGVVLTAFVGAGVQEYIVKKGTAEVVYRDGLYVFADSTPVTEYEYLGTIECVWTMYGQYNELMPEFARKAKRKFPKADAIIYKGGEKAEVIKFKD